jgi:4-carboxymuconolactone decarboxylase
MTDEFSRMFKTMVEQGQDMVRAFNPGLETLQVKGIETMFPTMSRDMMEMWFGKTFNREGLDAKTRLLVTIAALTVLGAQAEPQLRLAIRHAQEAGATQREIADVIWQMSLFGGVPATTVGAMSVAEGTCCSHDGWPLPPPPPRR